MWNRSRLAAGVLIGLLSGSTLAGECVLQVTRTARPSMEKESFSKCGGKPGCNETVPAASVSQCTLKAQAGCANKRLEITTYKKVTATCDGAAIKGGKNFCTGHPDFPYANKPACK